MSDDFVLRPPEEQDMNFIRASWMNEFLESGQRWSKKCDHAIVRDALLERGDVMIASLADVPTSICGWACTEPGVVHFVMVKPRWRRQGVARKLLAAFLDVPDVVYTHRTMILKRLPIPASWQFNPYGVLR